MNKKRERELNGPSWTEVILGAVLSLLLGIALAAVFLILKPVTTAKELPKEPVPGMVYYLEGSRDQAQARQAPAKKKTFLQGGSVSFNEDEVNFLATPTAAPLPATEKAKPAEQALMAGPPNVRIRDNVMQIGVPLQVSTFGINHRLIIQARGGFAKEGETFVFAPTELYLGSCPLQRLPVVPGILFKRFVAGLAVPDELSAAWQKLSDVTVEGATLRLTMQ